MPKAVGTGQRVYQIVFKVSDMNFSSLLIKK